MLTFRYNLNKRNNNMVFSITKMLSSHSCKKHYIASNDSHSYSFYMYTSCGFAKSIGCDRVVLKGQGIEHFKSKTFLGSFMMTKILMII